MNQSEWKTFLTEFNRELLSYEEVVEQLPREVIKSGWLGYPASEAKIAAAEKRLKTNLPPSYRAFLRVSNGWRFPSVSILDLRPANKIAWFEAPHELLAIFGVVSASDAMSDQEREAWYRNAVAQVDSNRPDLKKDPRAKAEYFFSLAKGSMEAEAVKLYETYGHTFTMAWDAAEYVAGAYVRSGKAKEAWAVIERNLSKWWPMSYAQVAPVVLLTDDSLRTIMTRERCQLVLSTPRGP